MTLSAAPTSERIPRISPDSIRILRDVRNLATNSFVRSFSAALERVGDLLIGRAQRSTDPVESSVLMKAREVIGEHRAGIAAEFERQFRYAIDARIRGQTVTTDGTASDSTVPEDAAPRVELKLLNDEEMDEAVLTGNIARVFDNLCESELLPLTRRVGAMLGQPDLELVGNPFAPASVFSAFRAACVSADPAVDTRLAVLRELNPTVLGDVKSIYADLNRHLINLNVLPDLRASAYRRRPAASAKQSTPAPVSPGAAGGHPGADLMAILQRVLTKTGGRGFSMPAAAADLQFPAGGDAGAALGSLLSAVGAASGTTSSDVPVMSALTRLQQGEAEFDLGDGTLVQITATAPPKHNVLRDIQESKLGERMNQIDAMTIELVAMLFDFVFIDKSVPDSVKLMVGRLQIPVLKAAMVDRAFFSKKSHPARVLVNRLAQAGVGWVPEMGHDDPLYRKIESIVTRVNNEFTDDLDLFVRVNEELEQFLAEEEQRTETTLRTSTEEVTRQDRLELARLAASAEIERRLLQPMLPGFVTNLLRKHWTGRIERIHVNEGDSSDAWSQDLALLDDLLWSVLPKRSVDERRRMTTTLPGMIKRLNAVFDSFEWGPDERKGVFDHLIEAHSAAIKAKSPPPSAAGDEEIVPAPRLAPDLGLEQDEFSDLAAEMTRGMWVEFEAEDGKLAYAKLAWISPLRGTLLFTNRQGQQAFSLTPFELGERFRANRARPIDAEPLVDRALSSMMSTLAGSDAEAALANA